MKIIYCGAQFNTYKASNPGRGETFEHHNFFASLAAYPGAEVSYFAFDLLPGLGRREWNEELLRKVKNEKPDLLFAFMYSDEFDPQILKEINKYTTTLAWFADDSWRFYNYSRFWARHFSWAVTTYSWMPPLYRAHRQPNVIRSQWAANPSLYKPAETDLVEVPPEVVFVGGWTRPRANIVRAIRDRGVEVKVYGGGWTDGVRVSEEEMVDLFSRSRVNLGLNPPPEYWNVNSLGRIFFRPSGKRIVPDLNLAANLQSWFARGIPQIKARHFQVPACGGFQVASMADDLDRFYEPGKEIVIYENVADLADKVKYYLAHEPERAKIAQAGYRRTVADHTYEKRFKEIFRTMFDI